MQRAPYAFWHFIELNRGGGTGDSLADWQAELGFIQVCGLPVRERIINTIFLALAAKGRVGLKRLGECGAVSVSPPDQNSRKVDEDEVWEPEEDPFRGTQEGRTTYASIICW